MMRKSSMWLSWLIVVFCLTGIVAANILFARVDPADHSSLILTLSFLAFPLVGAVIIAQRPTNTVGWIFCVIGLGTAITSYSAAYIQFALRFHLDGQLMTSVVDLVGNIVWPMNLATGVLLLFLFPDGKSLSPRWRLALWTLCGLLLVITSGQLVYPGALEPNGKVPNPLGVPALAGYSSFALKVGSAPLPVLAILAVVSLILRYRRARSMERAQIKWFVFGAAIMVAVVTAGIVGSLLISPNPNDPITLGVSDTTFALGVLALPIGAGVGVVRYRLYDIDILIKRTLVYGSLTAILAGLYFALVIGAQQLTHLWTGQNVAQQPLMIVLSTLLIAALVQPLRAWLQRNIDRRFYRNRYDAAKTVAAFSVSLRNEVDLARLNEHLLAVIHETMRPAHVSLWLRGEVAQPNSAHVVSSAAERGSQRW